MDGIARGRHGRAWSLLEICAGASLPWTLTIHTSLRILVLSGSPGSAIPLNRFPVAHHEIQRMSHGSSCL